jgi:hypothetical protein
MQAQRYRVIFAVVVLTLASAGALFPVSSAAKDSSASPAVRESCTSSTCSPAGNSHSRCASSTCTAAQSRAGKFRSFAVRAMCVSDSGTKPSCTAASLEIETRTRSPLEAMRKPRALAGESVSVSEFDGCQPYAGDALTATGATLAEVEFAVRVSDSTSTRATAEQSANAARKLIMQKFCARILRDASEMQVTKVWRV